MKLRDIVDKQIAKIEKGVDNACDQMGRELTEEIIKRVELPPEATLLDPNLYKYDTINQYNTYVNSIMGKKSHTLDDYLVEVGSNYLVDWDLAGGKVPFGVFIEWGTGPIGSITNTYDHGYPYTLDSPWDKATFEQRKMTGGWGMSARPHLVPGLMAYKPKVRQVILDNIRKAGN